MPMFCLCLTKGPSACFPSAPNVRLPGPAQLRALYLYCLVGFCFFYLNCWITCAETCTEFDWLFQFLSLRDSRSLSMTPSSTRKERMYTPVKVEYWDVAEEIEDYVSKADKLKRGYRKVDNRPFTGTERISKQIAGVFLSYMCDYFNTKRSGSLVEYALEASLKVPPGPLAEGGNSTNPDGSKAEDIENQKCRFYARDPRVDIVVRSDGNDAAVFELKNGGLGCPVRMCDLWARCSCRTGSARADPV